MTRQEIYQDWDWLFSNVSETLYSFDNEDDVSAFVMCKIESIVANRQQEIDIEGKVLLNIKKIQME